MAGTENQNWGDLAFGIRTEFLSFSTDDWNGYLALCRMFSSIPGFYPLDVKSTSQLRSESVSPSVLHNSSGPHGLYSPPGSSVHGILQARILEWLAIPFTRRSSRRKDWTQVAFIFIIWAIKEAQLSGWQPKTVYKTSPWGKKTKQTKKKKHWILLMFKSQQFLKWVWWSQITSAF